MNDPVLEIFKGKEIWYNQIHIAFSAETREGEGISRFVSDEKVEFVELVQFPWDPFGLKTKWFGFGVATYNYWDFFENLEDVGKYFLLGTVADCSDVGGRRVAYEDSIHINVSD